MKNKIDKHHVLRRINKALQYQFQSYSWNDMLNDCVLTPEELNWARENVDYKAYIIGE